MSVIREVRSVRVSDNGYPAARTLRSLFEHLRQYGAGQCVRVEAYGGEAMVPIHGGSYVTVETAIGLVGAIQSAEAATGTDGLARFSVMLVV